MKQLSQINQEVKRLAERIIEICDYDARDEFNTRGSHRDNYIVANIKVYDYIDESDVEEIIKENELFQEVSDEILEEFDSNRLINIWNHQAEDSIHHVKESLEERVHIADLHKRAVAYKQYCDGNDPGKSLEFYYKYYSEEFDRFRKRKHNAFKDYLRHIRKQDKFSTEEHDRLDTFTPEVYQFGRSGGWLSVCKATELEGAEYEGHVEEIINIEDNDQFNDALHDYMWLGHFKRKSGLVQEMKQFIWDWEERRDAIKHYVDEIEAEAKRFKDAVLDRLREEMHEFYHEQGVTTSNCSIHIENDMVKTSMGVSVDLGEFVKALREVEPKLSSLSDGRKVDINIRVGNYFVNYAKATKDDVLIKAGCHMFSMKQIKSTISTAA